MFRTRLYSIIVFIMALNIVVWLLALYYSKTYPVLLGLVSLTYGLGLRHAVDADHIAAIDNTTRKLVHDGQKPFTVGLFFALGHSTIVIVLSLLAAFSSSFVHSYLPGLTKIGPVIGGAVSSIFLLVIGLINLAVLIDLYKLWSNVDKNSKDYDMRIDKHLSAWGIIARLLKPVLKTVSKSWQMYPVGLLFGLGFDTSSEVALIALSAVSGTKGLPLICILLLPFAFTAGMTLIDTLDGFLMLGSYGWAYISPKRKLYYNLNITFISVIVALFIGGIEGLQVVSKQININTGIFRLTNQIKFEYLGSIIIGAFIISFLFSWTLYRFKK